MGCIASVPQDQAAITERFGKFDKVAEPGCLCLPVPCICRVAGMVSLRVQEVPVVVTTYTKDKVSVRITVNVQYMAIQDPKYLYEAYYKLTSPSGQIMSYVDDAVRSMVPHSLELDELFEAKGQVAQHVEKSLASEMETYGYKIVAALVTNVEPDETVRQSMNEINANKRLRQAAQERAEAQKYMTVKHAEANAESTYLQGEGIARQRKAIVDGLKSSVEDFKDSIQDMSAKEVLDLMLVTQYFDTIKDLGHGGGTSLVLTNKRGKAFDAEGMKGIMNKAAAAANASSAAPRVPRAAGDRSEEAVAVDVAEEQTQAPRAGFMGSLMFGGGGAGRGK
uniref:Band 7 domain-containing protein n=1 Tax=Vitrella brassicaformis TaxID=1169539 RepID=A0A6U4EPJ0_9ALVE